MKQKEYFLAQVINFAVFLFGALMLSISSGYSVAPFFLLIIALPFLFNKSFYVLSKPNLYFILSVFAYFLVQLFSVISDSEIKSRDFESVVRILISIIIFLLLCRYPPNFNAIIYGILVGSFIAGFRGFYQKLYLYSDRAFALENSTSVVQAGNICLSLGLSCACFSGYFFHRKCYWRSLLFLIGSVFGFCASFFSGTRGGWILLPFIILFLFITFRKITSKTEKFIATGLIILLISIAFIPQVGVTERIKDAKNDLTLFKSEKNKNTSLGIRFQLWQSSYYSFIERPIFGWGKKEIDESKKKQLEEKKITPYIYNYNSHAHSEYLNELAERGMIGLLSLLAVFIVPFSLFGKIFKDPKISNLETKTIAFVGSLIILSVADYCLSQSFLKHNSGIMFYFNFCAVFLAFCYPLKWQKNINLRQFYLSRICSERFK